MVDDAILIVVIVLLSVEYLLLLVLWRLSARWLLLTRAGRASRSSSLVILEIILDFSFEFDVELLPDHVAHLICSQFGIGVAIVVVGACMNVSWILLIHVLLFFIFIVVHAYLCV